VTGAAPVVHLRPVRFQDVDAAGIVFFARFFEYAHEAMERFFDVLPGQPVAAQHDTTTRAYVELITKRRIGFPTVHIAADFRGPLRYGDVARIETTVTKIGTTSWTFHYAMTREADGAEVATIEHVVVATTLDTVKKVPLPPDVRALLEARIRA
jgi:4-hydroxybenzoyl-CoA thioesterase